MKNPPMPDLPTALEREFDRMELERVWSALETAHPANRPTPEETDRAWEALSAELGLETATPGIGEGTAGGPGNAPQRNAESGPRPGRRFLLRAAAVAALLLGSAAVWQFTPVRYGAGAAERLTVVLPDGSRAELNAGSSLSHRRGFAWIPGVRSAPRTVRLQGEAFFDVVPEAQPFRVVTDGAVVRVLGTRFNVRAWASETGEVRVEVEEGQVEVGRQRSSGTRVILQAGESVRVPVDGEGNLERGRVAEERIAAWRGGGLTAVDEPLGAVLAELARRYGVEVTMNLEPGEEERLSVYYPELGSLESVLADLATQQSLRYRRTAQGWEIF